MQLYGSLTSPYVRKLRILLLEKKIDCEFKVATPSDNAELIKKYNPLGKVPVLVLQGNESLIDSPVIFEYLDSLGDARLIPDSGPSRWKTLHWQALADGIIDATVARMMETRRPTTLQYKEEFDKQSEKIIRALTYAENLASGAKYLVGGKFGGADIAMGAALGYIDFRFPHDWRGRHPKLAALQRELDQRESFRATVPPA